MNYFGAIISFGGVVIFIIIIGLAIAVSRFYRKVEQGQALVRNGVGGTRAIFSGILVFPVLHKHEIMDISVKRVTIDRHGEEGLICQDNMRADIKVAFFVRVNKTEEDVLKVAQSIGCHRASNRDDLQLLFEAKFSEALKTVGKQFDFVDLYNARERFKEEILKVIGTDLNGFVLDDAAIDFLEQTPLEKLNPNNILDAEGIKKITKLTAEQRIMANQIDREKEKTITQQDVDAKEAILEMSRQLAEAESKQKREIVSVQAREEAETKKVQEEERKKAETAKIATDEEIQVAEQNKNRQIVVALKNKERTEAVENERVEKDRLLEETERERIVALTRIEKDKAIEIEKKNIQDVIRERVMVEKTVVLEQERIKDTEAFALADREKRVAITKAEETAEEALVQDVKSAEASKQSAELKAQEELYREVKAAEASKNATELKAEEMVIEADAYQTAAEKKATAQKMLADAMAAEKAAPGLADAQVARAHNELIEQKGEAEANVMERKYQAEAKGIENKGQAEAGILEQKYQAEAKGIENKANAMKMLDGVGREHEEFKLQLSKEKDIELAEIDNRRQIAAYHSEILSHALKTARVDIVGGETAFFKNIVNAVSSGKAVDRYIDSSKNLSDVKETFFNSDPAFFQSQLKAFFTQFGLSADDVKDLSVSAALTKMIALAEKSEDRSSIYGLLSAAERSGLSNTLIKGLKSV